MSETLPPNPPHNDPAHVDAPPLPPEAQPSKSPPPQQQTPSPRRRRRRWPWVVLGIVVAILLLVLLAPMIASTGPVRSFVVGQVNDRLNGRVAIDDWSLGWTSGIRMQNLKVYDDRNAEILHAPRIATELSLLDAIRGNFDLGETVVDVANFVLRVDEGGGTNFEKLPKDAAEPGPPADLPPTELPNVRGNITVNYRGTVEYTGADQLQGNQTVHVEPSTASLKIPSINDSIEHEIALTYRVGDDPTTSTIGVTGTADVAQNNQLQLDELTATEKVALNRVNLGALGPFLAAFLPDTQLAGVANGGLDLDVKGLAGISAAGEIVVQDLAFGGAMLQGDVFRTDRLSIPVQVTRTVVDPNTTIINIEKLGAQMPEATVSVTGKLPQQAVQNWLDGKPPGSEGSVTLSVNVEDLGALANDLRNTLRLEDDAQITGGTLKSQSVINVLADRLAVTQTLDAAAQGTRGGQPIAIRPIHLESAIGLLPMSGTVPPLRDLKLQLDSAFAKVSGGGESLASLALNGSFDLESLHRELAQFADLGQMQLAGTGEFAVNTTGDPTSETEPIDLTATATVRNLLVSGIADQRVQQDRIALNASGQLRRENGQMAMLDNGSLTFTAGDPQSPLVDLAATADVNLVDNSAPEFAITKLAVTDLARVQQQFGGLVPQLAQQQIQVTQGQLYVEAAGSYADNRVSLTKPLSVSMPNLSVTKEGRPLVSRETIRANVNGSLTLPPGAIEGQFTEVSITTPSKLFAVQRGGDGPLAFRIEPDGTIHGNGALTLAADLKRLSEVAQAFGGQITVEGQPQLASGLFNGTVSLATLEGGGGTALALNGDVTSLSVTSGAGTAAPIQNEKVTLSFKATAPPEAAAASPITASGQLSSSFATADLSDVRVVPSAGTWDMIQSATVRATVPDLPKFYALVNAFLPEAPAEQTAAAVKRGEIELPPVSVAAAAMGMVTQPGEPPVSGDEPISRPRPDPRQEPAQRRPQPEPAAAAAAVEEPAAPVEPLEITGGQAALTLAVRREQNVTRVTLSDTQIDKLALRRGQREYRFLEPVTLQLAAAVNAVDKPDTPVAEQINSIELTQLAGALGPVATLSMPQPVVITGLGDRPKAAGAIAAAGQLQRLAPLLAVLAGSDEMPFSGDFAFQQKLSSEGDVIRLAGEITTTDFQVFDAPARQNLRFTEKQVAIRNDVSIDPQQQVAQIAALSVDMPQTRTLALDMTGAVRDWGQQRRLDNVKLQLTYDLEKLWPIVLPLLSPEQREGLKDLKIAGQFTRDFTVAGAFPAVGPGGEPLQWWQSIGSIDATGGLAVGLLDTQGLVVENLEVPVNVDNGVLKLEYAGRPREERYPKPFAVNGGTGNIGGIVVDLRHQTPRATTPKNLRLLQNVSINPLLGDALGKYVNPMFPNSERAQGLLDVTVQFAEKVALGEELRSAESGRARVVFSIRDMEIANPLGGLILGQLASAVGPFVSGLDRVSQEEAETFRGTIRDAVVTLENGVTTQDISLQLVDPGVPRDVIGARERPEATTLTPMRFQGTVNLGNLAEQLTVYIPPGLLLRSEKDRTNFVKIFPEGIPVSLKGTTLNPKLDLEGITQKLIEGQVKGLLGGEGGRPGAGGLLEDLLKRRDREQEPEREPPPRDR